MQVLGLLRPSHLPPHHDVNVRTLPELANCGSSMTIVAGAHRTLGSRVEQARLDVPAQGEMSEAIQVAPVFQVLYSSYWDRE
jgi:hypothetical protein